MRKALAVILLLSAIAGKAQTLDCPPNIDFEFGNFKNWYLYTGTCCPISTKTFWTNPVYNRHTITQGPGVDSFGRFPIVSPDGGFRSVKLGNANTGKEAERARYFLKVPSDQNSYSLTFRYAVVFQNPNHDSIEQPRFEVRAYDSTTGQPIECVQLVFVASAKLPGFTLSPTGRDVWYKPWTPVTLNLSRYAGHTLAIDFASGDCAKGGHFGYGYVDLACGLFQIASSVCPGTTTKNVTAPPGFEKYLWYDSSYKTLLATGMNATLPVIGKKTNYHVILIPYEGFGCKDTIHTELFVSDLATNPLRDTLVCSNKPLMLNTMSTASKRFQPLTYSWLRGPNLSCSDCPSPTIIPDKNAYYVFKVTDAIGCTMTDSIRLSTVETAFTEQPDDQTVCRNASALFTTVVKSNSPVSFQWKRNGVAIKGATDDSLLIAKVTFADTVSYSVDVITYCDTIHSLPAKLKLIPPPSLKMTVKNIRQCPGTEAVIEAEATDLSSDLQWFKDGGIIPGATKDTLIIAKFGFQHAGKYHVSTVETCDGNILDTVYSDTATARVHVKTTLLATPPSQVICEGKPTSFLTVATGDGPFSYQWKKADTDIPGATNPKLLFSGVLLSDTGAYTVSVTSDCDTLKTVSAYLTVTPQAEITSEPGDLNLCPGLQASLQIGVKENGPMHYLWYKNNVLIPGIDQDSIVFDPVKYEDAGTYFVKVVNLCDTLFSRVATVQVRPLPEVEAGPDTLICNESVFAYSASVTNADSVRWMHSSAGMFDDPAAVSGKFIPVGKFLGQEALKIVAFNGCGSDTDDLMLNLVPAFPAAFTCDTLVCEKGKPIDLVAQYPGGLFSGINVSGDVFNPVSVGTYLVTYDLDKAGCHRMESRRIEVVPKPVADFHSNTEVLTLDSAVQFISTSKRAIRYSWDFGDGSFSNEENPTHQYLAEKHYKVTLIAYSEFCTDETVREIDVLGSEALWIPNAFTPDGDGTNDGFRVYRMNTKGGNLSIYDRWGKLIFYTEDLNQAWDGTHEGKPCQGDVYTYVVNYRNNNGINFVRSGNVTLLR